MDIGDATSTPNSGENNMVAAVAPMSANKTFLCYVCGKSYNKPSKVLRHQRVVHPLIVQEKLESAVKKLNSEHQIKFSNSNQTQTQSSDKEQQAKHCSMCNRTFANSQNYKRHMRNVNHSVIRRNLKTKKCYECHSVFSCRELFVKHFRIAHKETVIKTETLSFTTVEEFQTWKTGIEKETTALFIRSGKYQTSSSSVRIYTCHRSGNFISKTTGKRRLKTKGSNKCGFYCPARIVKEFFYHPKNGISFKVKFTSTHIGHEMEVERLKLSKFEKQDSAEHLCTSVSPENSLSSIAKTPCPAIFLNSTTIQDIRNVTTNYILKAEDGIITADSRVRGMMAAGKNLLPVSPKNSLSSIAETPNSMISLNSTTSQDRRNVATSYVIKTIDGIISTDSWVRGMVAAEKNPLPVSPKNSLNSIAETPSPTISVNSTTAQSNVTTSCTYNMNDDVISMDSWVRRLMATENNPFLLYKHPGHYDRKLPNMDEDDFVLGFMNEVQEEIFRLYGSEVISIDCTHGANKHNIKLTSIVVKDDNWEGFPVAFLWSNRQTADIFKYFFVAIKSRIGNLKSKIFMSDDFPALYNAWSEVFSATKFRLICDWHVKRAWNQNITSGPNAIKNPRKRQDALNALNAMSSEVDKATFQFLLESNLSRWLDDPETSKFAQHFNLNYYERAPLWAACYRVGANINNTIAERWHKDLKYNSDLKGKYGGRLDKAIHILIKSLREKLVDRMTFFTRGELIKKAADIRKRHKMAEEVYKTIPVYQDATDSNSWIVPSFSKSGKAYKVRRLTLNYHLCNWYCNKCKTCLHEYCCNCPDSAVNFNFCKHMHTVCLKKCLKDLPSNILVSNGESDILEINTNKNCSIVEINAINGNLKKDEGRNLHQEAEAAIIGFLPELNQITSDKTLKEIIEVMTVLKNKAKAIDDREKSLPCVVQIRAKAKKKVQNLKDSFLLKREELKTITDCSNQSDMSVTEL